MYGQLKVEIKTIEKNNLVKLDSYEWMCLGMGELWGEHDIL